MVGIVRVMGGGEVVHEIGVDLLGVGCLVVSVGGPEMVAARHTRVSCNARTVPGGENMNYVDVKFYSPPKRQILNVPLSF